MAPGAVNMGKHTTPRINWSPLRTEIERRYPHEKTETIAKDIDVPLNKLYAQANNWGLKKTPEYLSSSDACRLRSGTDCGAPYRFKKGMIPKNKGVKGINYPGMEKTQFPPGHRPKNWKPIGSERICDGFIQRKLTDTGYPPRDWVSVHHIVWRDHNGDIPTGHVIIFKDGNRENIAIENLQCITLKENMQRNSIHNLPDDLKKIIHLNGVLKKRINHANKQSKK